MIELCRLGSLAALAALLTACSGPPLPTGARPPDLAIAKQTGTSNFRILSGPTHSQGAWGVCIGFDDNAAFIKAVRTVSQEPDRDEAYALGDLRAAAFFTERDGWRLVYWDSNGIDACRSPGWFRWYLRFIDLLF